MSNSLLSFRVFSSFYSSSSTDLRRLYRRKMIVAAGIIPASSPYHTFPGFVPHISFASIEYVAHVFDLSSRFFRSFHATFSPFFQNSVYFYSWYSHAGRGKCFARLDLRKELCVWFSEIFAKIGTESKGIGLNFDIRMSPNIKIYHSS